MRTAIRSRRLLWLLLGMAIIASLAVAGEIRGRQASAQAPLVHSQDLPPGPSLVGWVRPPPPPPPPSSPPTRRSPPSGGSTPPTTPGSSTPPPCPPSSAPPSPSTAATASSPSSAAPPASISPSRSSPPAPANPSPSPTASDGPPAITINTPLAGSALGSPLTVTGLAGTFEANVQARLLVDGAEIAFTFGAAAEAFVLSPYSLALPFSVAAPTPACLEAFTTSARDGARILIVQVPLILVP